MILQILTSTKSSSLHTLTQLKKRSIDRLDLNPNQTRMFLIASTSAARIAAVTSCVVTAVACETFRILRRRQKRQKRRKQKQRRQVSDFENEIQKTRD